MMGEDFSIQDNRTISVNIGGWFVTTSGEMITTLLGSCIAVCLYDTAHPVAGMNHILLPGDADLHRATPSARYGVHSMELLINGLLKEGASRKRLAAKVFGGASVISIVSETFNMGERNIRFVKEFLALEKIPIISSHLGGEHARRIYFDTRSRDVLMKRIKPVLEQRIREQELLDLKKRKSLLKADDGEVDLFS